MGTSAWQPAMNRRLRSTSRLATATTVELPVLRMAFQFLRAICAVLRMPQRSLFVVIDSCRNRAALFVSHAGRLGFQTLPFRGLGEWIVNQHGNRNREDPPDGRFPVP